MLGLILVLGSSLFQEIGITIGKKGVREHKESIYTFGFLTVLWSGIFFFAYAFLVTGEFVFLLASLPTFLIRAVLEIAQTHIATLAIVKADRSTVGFLMVLTVPLLLGADIFLEYEIYATQIIGIVIVLTTIAMLWHNHGIRTRGIFYVLFTAINAVITISLYKYNITHFNSVEAEQGIILAILMVYFGLMAFFVARENVFSFAARPLFLFQSLASGSGTVLVSFAYLFGAASVIATAKRAFNILAAILAGNLVFHEKKTKTKLIALAFIVVGLIFLVI